LSGEAVHRCAEQPLHADHTRPAQLAVHLGSGDPAVVPEGVDVGAEPLLPVGLEDEVELLVGDLVQVFDDAGGVEEMAGAGAVDQPGDAVHDP
jgi:hypothetical protein